MAPLDNLIVVDFSHALAGPYCTMLMAAYGAQVYKIESTGSGDMGRTWGPPFQGGEASYFLGLNSGKQGVAINLKDPRGLDLCRDMVRRADVLIENFRPGTMSRLGLDWPAARTLNSRLIYCSISGYGQTGPSRDDPAMDLILQASSGLISTTGNSATSTARCGHSVADITAGMFALTGVLMALEARHRTGMGQFIDVSMLDGMISAMASNYAYMFGSGTVPTPLGTAFATIVPYACFPTADGEMAIAVASEKLWTLFCAAVEHPEWEHDPRFATNRDRVANRGILEPMVTEVLRYRTSTEWTGLFCKHGVPCAAVRNLRQVADDPHAAHREMFPVLGHPTAGPVRVTGVPIKFSETPGGIKSAAPVSGQHTREALAGLLGLGAERIGELARAGVIHCAH
ncbi:MAG: CoA transferase [Acidobacteria bacterium]|nr:CoA transferase [Acidobacteriota bacterium]